MFLDVIKQKKIFFIFTVVFVTFDQIAKFIILAKFPFGEKIPVFGDIFSISYATNTGAAFGIFKGQNDFFIFFSLFFLAFIIGYVLYKKNLEIILQISLSFIVSGTIGNLIDRILRGYVIDFFDLKYFSVFNTADVLINIGVISLIYKVFILDNNKTQEKK